MARCIALVFASSKNKFSRLSCAKVWLNNVESPQKGKRKCKLCCYDAKTRLW